MRRLLATMAICAAGCSPGGVDDSHRAGGTYVLVEPALFWADGPGDGDFVPMRTGTIVRVLESDRLYAKVYIERTPPDSLGLGGGFAGRTGWLPRDFEGAPTAYDP